MNNPINISGANLEDLMENFLKTNNLPYTRNSNGVDFIVGSNQYYIECKNQTQGGSVIEKLPHTIWKYKMKYDFDSLYIVQPYTDGMGKVMEHIKWLENTMGIVVYIVSYDSMCNILINSNIESPSMYWD